MKNFIYSHEGNFAEDNPDSLKKFFGIKDIRTYADMPISDLDFSYRAINQLKNNNCRTLEELLKYSKTDLFNMRNLGVGSVENILHTLEKFFNSKKSEKILASQDDTFARKNIDEFLLNAILNNDPYINVIIDAFEKFSELIIKKSYFKNTIAKKISNLLEEIKNKNLLPFIQAYNFVGNNLSQLPATKVASLGSETPICLDTANLLSVNQ